MSLIDSIIAKSKTRRMRIVLPEGDEPRTLKAAKTILSEGIADLIMLGDEQVIRNGLGTDASKVTIINPASSDQLQQFADAFYELRRAKGMTPDKALETMKDVSYFGTMLVYMGQADGMVSGAVHSTGDTLRPSLQIIKTAPGYNTVSSCFVMESPRAEFGDQGVMIFGDCAVIPNPTAQELAEIAVASAQTGRALAGMTPRVAMLSFSTKGSAKHELVDKVAQATELARQLQPDLLIDGELQADAALVEAVGQLKSPGSAVAGKANVLVFPDLQAGNIGYKLVERLGSAAAIGPILQGLKKPVNDLSRGCSVEDIVAVVAITTVQAMQA